ncbi:MAG: PD40 domain-containing protein [Acidobacteria bacterium]|nr:PD40 domain-containing protein [Acidobacteriota bacterium]
MKNFYLRAPRYMVWLSVLSLVVGVNFLKQPPVVESNTQAIISKQLSAADKPSSEVGRQPDWTGGIQGRQEEKQSRLTAAPNVQYTVQGVSLAAGQLETGNGGSSIEVHNTVSDDGRYVVFTSTATNLAAGQIDANETDDVFVFDRVTQAVQLVSRAAGITTGNGFSFSPMISGDGRWIAFESVATNLVLGQTDTNGTFGNDVFLFDRVTETMQLVSRVAGTTTTTGNKGTSTHVISADGQWIAFGSEATNLVTGQTDMNGNLDVFVFDRIGQTVQLVSRATGTTTTTGNSYSFNPEISADGQWIAFGSEATNLVTGQIDTNGSNDVFVFDRIGQTVQLVSRAAGTATTTSNGFSQEPAISADGQWIAFMSEATNLVTGQIDTNGSNDVFAFDRVGETIQVVSRAAGTSLTTSNGYSFNPEISADGQWIAVRSFSTDLVIGQTDTNFCDDVFVFDRVGGTMQLVSRAAGTTATTGTSFSEEPEISANGRWIAFRSISTNLVTGQTDTNENHDVFLFDRVTETMQLVSRAAGATTTTGNAISRMPSLSADGKFVAFQSMASDLIAGDLNLTEDVFLFGATPITGTVTGGGTICIGQSATVKVTISEGVPPYTVTLDHGGGTKTGNSPLTFTVSPLTTITYTVQSGTDADGCLLIGSGNATVTVNSCPKLQILMVADTINNRVQRFDGNTWSVIGTGTVGSGNGQFNRPEAVAFDDAGRIYVADFGNSRIQWSTDSGTTWATFAASGFGLGQVRFPQGLALDINGNLYVSDTGNGRVLRFNNGVPGNAVVIVANGRGSGRIGLPHGLAIDSAFRLFVTDEGYNQILRITNAHTVMWSTSGTSIATKGTALNQVMKPQGIALDPNGTLYIADTGNSRMLRWTNANPNTSTALALTGSQLGQVNRPEGVTIKFFLTGPFAGNLLLVVSDTMNNRIQGRFVPTGQWKLVGVPNGLGTAIGSFRNPSKIQ